MRLKRNTLPIPRSIFPKSTETKRRMSFLLLPMMRFTQRPHIQLVSL
uniref:Uncharacterized protein n=1 Tax=Siphoviridae sp. ctNEy24 TaxID=2825466 RepID=A0A8S5U0K1_9CAUD|nr:MAG TPA: hypothetical protein [Siphoviridae sp. ctNEy24]